MTDGMMALHLEEACLEKQRAEIAFKHLKAHSDEQIAVKDADIAEKDALILEWMHSNEAFKRLARQYGKKLGVSDEERVETFSEEILNVAEEDPKFRNTELKGKAEALIKPKKKAG